LKLSSWTCIFPLLIAGLISSCQQQHAPVPTPARIYFRQAFDSIEKYSLRRNDVNLDSIEFYYFRQLHDTMPLKYAYHYLREASMAIDPHSDFFRPQKIREKGKQPKNLYSFRGRRIADTYVYLDIHGCQALDSVSCKLYADSLASLVSSLYWSGQNGWVIDLRSNHGGNMYPTLAGLSALLGEGILGYDIYPNGHQKAWYVFKWDSIAGKIDSIELLDTVHRIPRKMPIVVITGEETGSAGEALVLSFRKNPSVKIMGTPTAGFATGNTLIFMSDSGALNITSSFLADREGEYFDGPVPPDLVVEDPVRLFSEAYQWIDSMQGSRAPDP
jgi:carboxyl-terminal processing protease